MSYLMGVDLGTSSVRAMIVRRGGTVLAPEGEEYDVKIPKPFHAEQEPELWYKKATACIGRAIRKSGVKADDIAAIGFSGQMHGLVCVDKAGKPVIPAIIWPDQRSAGAIADLYAKLGRETVARCTQNSVATGFLLASLYWLYLNDRASYDKTHKVMLPKDYIKFRLSGRIITDYSDAAGSLAFDNVNLRWAEEVITGLGLDMEKFPPCAPSTEVVGEVCEAAAKDTGLSRRTRLVNGGADQTMQAIGNGIVSDGVYSASIGTGGQISVSMTKPVFDPGLRTTTFAHALPGRWYVMGAHLGSGQSLKWFANNILADGDFAALSREAAKTPPGADGLVFLPYIVGERTPHLDPKAKGMFFGLMLGHNRYHMVRSVMEGVAYSFKDSLELTIAMGIPCNRLIASGGGAKSDLWLQIQADILERDVRKSLATEQACLGAALTAGVGVSVYSNFEQACGEFVKIDEAVYRPREEYARLYRDGYAMYKELYVKNADLMHRSASAT